MQAQRSSFLASSVPGSSELIALPALLPELFVFPAAPGPAIAKSPPIQSRLPKAVVPPPPPKRLTRQDTRAWILSNNPTLRHAHDYECDLYHRWRLLSNAARGYGIFLLPDDPPETAVLAPALFSDIAPSVLPLLEKCADAFICLTIEPVIRYPVGADEADMINLPLVAAAARLIADDMSLRPWNDLPQVRQLASELNGLENCRWDSGQYYSTTETVITQDLPQASVLSDVAGALTTLVLDNGTQDWWSQCICDEI